MSFPTVTVPNLEKLLTVLLDQLPTGRVTTFGTLARCWGDVGAARTVAEILRGHAHTNNCPCHRVVTQDGSLIDWQLPGLLAEGVPILANGRVDLESANFADFRTTQPLAGLRSRQLDLAKQVLICPLDAPVERVAGVDVSYAGKKLAVAAYAEVSADTGELLIVRTRAATVQFPYIPRYLAFRELPSILPLMKNVLDEQLSGFADVLLVDGNGMLHPELVGIASHLGVLLDQPTVGVGKTLLCGKVDVEGMEHGERRPVLLGSKIIAYAVRGPRSAKPLYVSVGHRITLDEATDLVESLILTHHLPEPIFHADHLSRVAAKQLFCA